MEDKKGPGDTGDQSPSWRLVAKETPKEPFPWVRLVTNIVCVLLSFITVAPIGLMYMIGTQKFAENLTEEYMAGFWLLYLPTAAYGSATRRRTTNGGPVGAILTFFILAVTMLNLGGCISALQGFGKATGG